MEKTLNKVLRNQAVLSNYRLTVSNTEVEYWRYTKGFLEHARELHRGERSGIPQSRRKDNLNALRNNIRRLVNANNLRYGYEPCFLTFTYAVNQSDISCAWADWHRFMRDLRNVLGPLHALTVMEFQKRGAVHFHCIFFNLSPNIEDSERCPARVCYAFRDGFCPHKKDARKIAILWGHGFVDIERVRSARNVGAYVCKYLNKSADDERLRGKKFYSTTRNLFRPQTYTGEFAQNKFERIMGESNLKLQAETQYAYNGAPVVYQNYKIMN